ncbi:MAG TPA: DUF6069 family protein [Streptosporangiaceae bacterium]|nr:DUF6069 family protein [Streptosporangiaceae bacterium]
MLTSATARTTAAHDVRPGRARALCAAGGAAAAVLAWLVEVPLLGIHLSFQFGAGQVQTISAPQAAGVALAAGLLGWLLLAVLERRTVRASRYWVAIALVALAASLALPLVAATTTSAIIGLIVMHLAVGIAVIPPLALTARPK